MQTCVQIPTNHYHTYRHVYSSQPTTITHADMCTYPNQPLSHMQTNHKTNTHEYIAFVFTDWIQWHSQHIQHMIIMEISKAPTLWLKALNKHNLTHVMYIEMKKVIWNFTKANTKCTPQQGFNHNYVQHTHTHMHTHTHTHMHTHTLYGLTGVKNSVA